jgi:hypothetical protein
MIKLAKPVWVFMVVTIFFSCGGSLTPEQREKARKAIEDGQIKRITPAELMEIALKKGKKIVEDVGGKDSFFNNAAAVDSLARENDVIIYALKPGMPGISKVESDIAEAYQAQGDIAGVGDNIQKLSDDSLLYTMPVGYERPDGSRPFSHAIAVKISVRQLVLSFKQ